MAILTHKIRLDPTCKQRRYFARAAGTHRFVFNWGLAEWNRRYSAGEKPNGNELLRKFNSIYAEEFPWISDVHRDCHSQPFADLQQAFGNFFSTRGRRPTFKRKNVDRRSFYVANDRLAVAAKWVRLPRIGKVLVREALRFTGKINSARVVEDGDHWSICISVDVGEVPKQRVADGVVGVDLGIKSLATLSTGEVIENPRPLKKVQSRLRRAQRILSRRKKGSNNRNKQKRAVAKIHMRVRNIRHDNLHKLTTRLCRENQTVVIEDLNVKGMMKNHSLAQSIGDASFSMFRSLLTYKAQQYGTQVIVADRFYPSSKKCSNCGCVKGELPLVARTYRCECGSVLDRDLNAALNLLKLGVACPEVTPVERSPDLVEAGTKKYSSGGTL